MNRTKKISLFFSIFTSSLLNADIVVDKIIEAKRIQKIDNIIKQENFLIERIASYVSSTADLTPTRSEIQRFYNLSTDAFKNYLGETCANTSGYCNDNTTGGITIDLDLNKNQIIIGNVLGESRQITESENKRYRTSTVKQENAETSSNGALRKYSIADYDKLVSAISIVQTVEDNKANSVLQTTTPASGDRNKMWLKPVGDGSFEANIFNIETEKWESRGAVSGDYNPSRGGAAPQITFYKNDKFDPAKTIGQKGWVVNVETKYGFGQYKHNGVEWIQVSAPDNKVYEFADIESLMTDHFGDPLGSIVSGITIPNTSLVVEFTKYSKYWATKDGMFFVVDDKENLPLTVKNGARGWTKTGDLILEYDAVINDWVILLADINEFKAKLGYFKNFDYIKLQSDGRKYKYFSSHAAIASLDGIIGYSFQAHVIGQLSPTYFGMVENGVMHDIAYGGAFTTTIRRLPYGNPSGQSTLQFYAETNGMTFATWVTASYNESAYIVFNINGEYNWVYKPGVFYNYKGSTSAKFYSQLNIGERVGNTFYYPNLPYAQAGQKLYADRDGSRAYYYEIIEYTGQADGTWTSSLSADPTVNYTFANFDQAFPNPRPFTDGQVAKIIGYDNTFLTWQQNSWHPIASGVKMIPVKYGKQLEYATYYTAGDFIGVSSDGKYYYSKPYPAATFVEALKYCSRSNLEADRLPSLAQTTAGDGEIAASGLDYMWTMDSTVAGTRVVFNGSNRKVASENESYPYRCVVNYRGDVFSQ